MRQKILISLATVCIYLTGCGAGGDGQAEAALSANDPRITGVATEMLAAINAARAKQRTCGSTAMPAVGSVTWNDRLGLAALRHTADMASHGMMNHTGIDGSTLSTRITDVGYVYRSVGENIAVGQPTVAAVVAGWLTSPGHCTNIMTASFTEIGAASAPGSYSGYPNMRFWTLNLASPR